MQKNKATASAPAVGTEAAPAAERRRRRIQGLTRRLSWPASGAALLVAGQTAAAWAGEHAVAVHCADVALAAGYLYLLRRLSKAVARTTSRPLIG